MCGILVLMLSCLPLLCVHLVHLLLPHSFNLLLLPLLFKALLLDLLLLLHVVVLLLVVGLEGRGESGPLLLLLAVLKEMQQIELLVW